MGEPLSLPHRRTYPDATMAQSTPASRVTLAVTRLVACVTVAAALLAVVLPVATGRDYLPDLVRTPEVFVACSFALAGAWLARHEDARPMGVLLLVVAASAAAYLLSLSVAAWTVDYGSGPPTPPGAVGTGAAWLVTWTWVPAAGIALVLLAYVVPSGRSLPGAWRWPARLVVADLVALATLSALRPGEVGELGIDNPAGLALDGLGVVAGAAYGVAILLALVGVVSLLVRFARADGTERRQIGWFVYAVVALVVASAVAPWWVRGLAVLMVPAAIVLATVRHRLYDIDVLLNRTLVGAILLGGAALAYAAVVGWVGSLLGGASTLSSFVAAFTLALLFHPARIRVQQGVDRVLYGRLGDPHALLLDVDEACRTAATPQQAMASALAVITGAMRLGSAYVEVARRDGSTLTVGRRAADDPGPEHRQPLLHQGEQVGELVVTARSARERIEPREVSLLGTLAGPVSSVAQNLRLTEDLAAARSRVVVGREEERARLRRDLHDGLGPQLAAVVLTVDTASAALRRHDTGRTGELLAEAREHARTAVQDVRHLVEGLRPPALDELGLVRALQTTGPAAAWDGVDIAVAGGRPLAPLPAAVEVAAYRIAQEAVTNAVRHASPTRVQVRLLREDGRLVVEVEDDGRGIAPHSRPGTGMTAMVERSAELGGTVTHVRAASGGTLVQAVLPLPQEENA